MCPVLVQYSQEQQAGLADELSGPGAGTFTRAFIADYARLRDQLRLCQ